MVRKSVILSTLVLSVYVGRDSFGAAAERKAASKQLLPAHYLDPALPVCCCGRESLRARVSLSLVRACARNSEGGGMDRE